MAPAGRSVGTEPGDFVRPSETSRNFVCNTRPMALGLKRATFHSETVLKLQKDCCKKCHLADFYIIKIFQKDAFCCGIDPSILDNRSLRGGSRDHLKKHQKFRNGRIQINGTNWRIRTHESWKWRWIHIRNTAAASNFFLSFLFFVQVKGIPFDATDPEVSGKDLFRWVIWKTFALN